MKLRCQIIEQEGWTLQLQWIPPHGGAHGNNVSGSLTKADHQDEYPELFFIRCVQARLLLRGIPCLHRRDVQVVSGGSPLPVPHTGFSGSDAPLLHSLRCDWVLTNDTVVKIDPLQDRSCLRYGALEINAPIFERLYNMQ